MRDLRVGGKSRVLLRTPRNQGHSPLCIVVNPPAVALAQRRRPQTRLTLREELGASCGVARVDSFSQRVRLEDDVVRGHLVGALRDQPIVQRRDGEVLRDRRLDAALSATVLRDIDESALVVRRVCAHEASMA
ncbi:hypothetical protein DC31_00725 [Microbacterium sp. CH12i]|nr:hypothetical protein DC31_00725 [Microbacterium sp. CH12i]